MLGPEGLPHRQLFGNSSHQIFTVFLQFQISPNHSYMVDIGTGICYLFLHKVKRPCFPVMSALGSLTFLLPMSLTNSNYNWFTSFCTLSIENNTMILGLSTYNEIWKPARTLGYWEKMPKCLLERFKLKYMYI